MGLVLDLRPFFEAGSLAINTVCARLVGLQASGDSPVSTSGLCLRDSGITDIGYHICLYMGCGDLNSDPDACVASILSSEPCL